MRVSKFVMRISVRTHRSTVAPTLHKAGINFIDFIKELFAEQN